MDWKQELFKRLDALAEKLGTTTTYLWGVLVKQAKLEGIFAAITVVICLVFASLLWFYFVPKVVCWSRKNNWEEFEHFISPLGLVGAAIFFTIAAYIHLQTFFYLYFNPDFGALQKVAEILK